MADAILEQIAAFIQPLRVKPGAKVTLADDFDPRYKAGFVNRKEARSVLQQGVDLLSEYQTRLAAQATHGLLVCLQGLDAAGKDGTIRHVMSGVNPQGVRVTSFKSPSSSELAHDFLWRHAVRLPARGEIAIFNRSHYEEVLVVRVHPELLERQNIPNLPKGHGVWSRRYRDINDWERYLDDNGIKIVKLFLNLSKDEQRVRFLRRLDVPDRNWKFSAADIRERQYWSDYQRAYSDMLSATSTECAPWYVIPADRKWFARICVSAVLAHTLIDLDPQYPTVSADQKDELERAKALLEAEEDSGPGTDRSEAEPR